MTLYEFLKIGKNLRRLRLIVGLMLYLFDYGSDIFVAFQYWKHNEYWWFGLTTGLIVVPSIIVNITAISKLMTETRKSVFDCTLHLSVVIRYMETLVSLDSSDIYFLTKLRYLETITESAPQWCLQVYIMLRQWSFPSYTVVSIVLSFLSLAWSITTLEKERKLHEMKSFNFCAAVLFLIWQLSTLVSRLSAIVIVAYVFRYYVIVFLAVHWWLVTMTMQAIQQEKFNCRESFILSCLVGYPSFFHSLKTVLPTASPNFEMIVSLAYIIAENVGCVLLLFLVHPNSDVQHVDVLKPILILCIAAGTDSSFIFFNFYYYRFELDSLETVQSQVYGRSGEARVVVLGGQNLSAEGASLTSGVRGYTSR